MEETLTPSGATSTTNPVSTPKTRSRTRGARWMAAWVATVVVLAYLALGLVVARIRAQLGFPNHVLGRLNGVTMVDFTDPTPKSFDGTIALQLHAGGGGNMEFKDIYLRDMTVR